MERLGLKVLAVCALAATVGFAAAESASLTGMNWYTLDSSHHYTGGYANTYGGDTYSLNLYVTENQQVGFGPLLNSGNLTTLPTRVQIDLSTPGTYTFQMYCNGDHSAATPFWGLNLFFNQDDLHPGISVSNVVNTPGFQTLSAIGTPTLDPLSMGLVQSSSGSGDQPIAYLEDTKVKLTAYNTWSSDHYNVDRVDNFSDDGGLGNGVRDQVIEFTLQVTTVPEPCTLLALGVCSLALIRRRRAIRA